MRTRIALTIAAGLAIAPVGAAPAQDMQSRTAPGTMQGGGDQPMGPAEQTMPQCMMQGMGSAMSGQTRHRMMSSGMMGSGMTQGGSKGGMSALFGSHVTPVMNLSIDDVRGYLALQLEHLNNKRLKLGDIKAEEGTITADIVTADNSLVQRLKVDQHTGIIKYEN